MKILLVVFLFYVAVTSAPVKEQDNRDEKNEESRNEKHDSTNEKDNSIKENNDAETARAGIVDTLNPFNNNLPTADKNKDNEQSNNPLSGIPNLFNISNNPFAQLFPSSSGNGNLLNDVKIFLVGSQGMVFPASAILGGFQNFLQAMGNMGNLVQGAQNLIPSLPGS